MEDEQETNLYCPLCGNKLLIVDGSLICDDGHGWEIVEDEGYPEFFSLKCVQR